MLMELFWRMGGRRDISRVSALFAVGAFCALLACGVSAAEGLVGGEQRSAVAHALTGKWVSAVGNQRVELVLAASGAFALGGRTGTFSLEDDALKFRTAEGEWAYQFKLDGQTLSLSGGDLRAELRLTRQPDAMGMVGWIGSALGGAAEYKSVRMLAIVVVVLLARLLIWLLRRISHFVIVSNRGPLRYLYTGKKKRSLTINSLILNVVKYGIYLVALGAVLFELGINYMAYVASLSVVGLAIGFGSQGLVQDMVTGLAVVLDEQFDVGDLVEISGQVGFVEELGLRTTRIRNYQGQRVVIPNRNIAVVGNYVSGGLRAQVDVAVADKAAAERASGLLKKIADEIARQFEGVSLAPPAVTAPLGLQTGEVFVRLELLIWPAQTWFVDVQLLPRIREAMKREAVEIPADRIAVSYHANIRRADVVPFWKRSGKASSADDDSGKAAVS